MRMDSTNSVFMPTSLPNSLLGLWRPLKELRHLEITNCNTLVYWPHEFKHLNMLIRLSIRMCPNLVGPHTNKEYNGYLFNLKRLELCGCSSLRQLPNISRLQFEVLELDECPKIEFVPNDFSWYRSMLYLSCTSWSSLPSLKRFSKLKTLWVSECYSLMSFPKELASISLDILVIHECPMVKELPGDPNTMLSSLKKLQISMCPDLENFCKEGPYSSIISKIGKSADDVEKNEYVENNEEDDENDDEEDDEDDEENEYDENNEEDDEDDEYNEEDDEDDENEENKSDENNEEDVEDDDDDENDNEVIMDNEYNEKNEENDEVNEETDVDITYKSFLSLVEELENTGEQKRRMKVLDIIQGGKMITFTRKKRTLRPTLEGVEQEFEVKKEVASPVLSPKRSLKDGKQESEEPICDFAQDDHPSFSPKRSLKDGEQESQQPLYNLAQMDDPSFSLGLPQSPLKKKEIINVKESHVEKPIIHVKERPVVLEKPIIYVRESPMVEEKQSTEVKQDPSDIRVPKCRYQPNSQVMKQQSKKKTTKEKNPDIEELETILTTQEGEPYQEEISYIHEHGPIGEEFKTWIVSAVKKEEVELPVVAFRSREEIKDWSYFTDSIYSDNSEVPCSDKIPLPDKSQEHGYKDLLSDEAINLLDACIQKYEKKELSINDYPFKNEEANVFCTIDQFKELVFSQNTIGAEIVEITCFLMQAEIPVEEEWFFLSSYITVMAPKTDWIKLLKIAPQLFSEQFSKARWLFVPLCGLYHWLLAAVDLKNKEIKMYNSCSTETNDHYVKPHKKTLEWLRFFLAWRMGDEHWNNVELNWQNDIPKQSSSYDCAIFVVRYIDCLIRNVPMDFDQDIIRKERLNLGYNILIHDKNNFKWRG